MKFLNKETNSIIEVDKKDKLRIKKFKGYPDKFEVIEKEVKEEKEENQFKIDEPEENEGFEEEANKKNK